MKDLVEQIKTRYEGFLPRERMLILGAIIAVVYLLWEFVGIKPVTSEIESFQIQESKLQKSINTVDAELSVLTQLAKRDPTVMLKQEISALKKKLAEIDERLAQLSVGLIPADQLPAMLHDVLKSNERLQLIKLNTLPPAEVALERVESDGEATNDTVEAASSEVQSAKLYRHGVELHLRGGYVALVEYLSNLEQGEWKFYWEDLHYSVVDYPHAESTLKVFTLSGDRGLFDE